MYDIETPDIGKKPPAWKENEVDDEAEKEEVVEESVEAGNKDPNGLKNRLGVGGTSGRGLGGSGFSLYWCSGTVSVECVERERVARTGDPSLVHLRPPQMNRSVSASRQ